MSGWFHGVLKRLDDALADFYSRSMLKRYIAGTLRRLFTVRLAQLISDSFVVKAFRGFIAMLFQYVVKPVFELSATCYNGSAFLNAIGRAAENHRWISSI